MATAAQFHGWTQDRINILEKTWADGLSASQIARRLGGVSRNAVIGKVHRLGLARRADSPRRRDGQGSLNLPLFTQRQDNPKLFVRKKVAKRLPVADAPAIEAKPAVVAKVLARMALIQEVPEPLKIHLLDLKEGSCRWAINSPAVGEVFLFCGHQKEHGSFCERHAARVYQRAR